MTALGPEARALVEAAREHVAPLSIDERARIRENLLAAATATTSLSLTSAAAVKLTLLKAASASSLLVGASLLLGGAGAYYAFNAGHPGRAPVLTARGAPLRSPAAGTLRAPPPPGLSTSGISGAPGTPAETRPIQLGEPPAATEQERRVPHPRAAPERRPAAPLARAGSATSGFGEDARLLREVHAALSSGEQERALSLLDARRAKGGLGALAEEREAARVVTLCELGRQAEARSAAQHFLAQHPNSPLSERVRRSCAEGAEGADERRTKGP